LNLKRIIVPIFVALLLPLSATAAPPDRLGGLPVVVLQGTHYERGVAHGQALHTQIVDLVDNYLAKKAASPILFFMMLQQVAPLMETHAGLQDEARGLVDGAKKANGGTFRSRYRDEDFTWQEILALNTYVDYIGTACSSVSAWGEATSEGELKGGALLARNLDWSLSPDLLRNQALFVHLPAEAGEQPFVSVGFAGFLGCLSCINQAGLGAFLNLGYGDAAGTFPPSEKFLPAALAFRLAVETVAPPDKSLLDHFVARLTAHHHVGSFIIQAIAPRAPGQEAAVVVELQAGTHALRTAKDDRQFSHPVLVATNHNRKAGKARTCQRYSIAVAAAQKTGRAFDPDRLWKLLTKMQRSDTMQRMLLVPSTGEFRLSVRQAGAKLPTKIKSLVKQPFAPVESTTLKELFTP
jgi:hypothetical protein